MEVFKNADATVRTNFSYENLIAIKRVNEVCNELTAVLGEGNMLVNPDTEESISYYDIQKTRDVLMSLFSHDFYPWKVMEE